MSVAIQRENVSMILRTLVSHFSEKFFCIPHNSIKIVKSFWFRLYLQYRTIKKFYIQKTGLGKIGTFEASSRQPALALKGPAEQTLTIAGRSRPVPAGGTPAGQPGGLPAGTHTTHSSLD